MAWTSVIVAHWPGTGSGTNIARPPDGNDGRSLDLGSWWTTVTAERVSARRASSRSACRGRRWESTRNTTGPPAMAPSLSAPGDSCKSLQFLIALQADRLYGRNV